MRVLITGASGFVGRHLIEHLQSSQPAHELHGTVLLPDVGLPSDVTWHTVDLRDETAAHDLIEQVKPDQIYHLAGQAFVPQSFESPWDTMETNIRPQLNL
ncbi:MAG: NAD-dependent epimerase/dehydratase family protein, partial [Anaerolineae bacterium]|nr:NAD-dependent epimerase/dehydratase family protein [Anaerolineae bacterium]